MDYLTSSANRSFLFRFDLSKTSDSAIFVSTRQRLILCFQAAELPKGMPLFFFKKKKLLPPIKTGTRISPEMRPTFESIGFFFKKQRDIRQKKTKLIEIKKFKSFSLMM